MTTRLLTIAALLASTTSAYAVGLDRSGQRIDAIFAEGNEATLSFGYTNPSLSGNALASGASTGNVGDEFGQFSGSIKYDINDRWSIAVIADEPFGADVFYGNDPAASVLGGTAASVDSFALTALARYKITDRFSVHGGIRYQEVSAEVALGGLAFGGINGYESEFDADGDVGYVIGVAYEIPDIALRVALTYNSSTTHDLKTTETLNGIPASLVAGLDDESTTEVETPDSFNLSFQTGVAPDTLVFGNIRYARYSTTTVSPELFDLLVDPASPGNSLTDLESGYDIELGVARRFNEKWSGSVTIGVTTQGEDEFVSPLGPNNGSRFIAIGARYDVNEDVAISGGIRYTQLGDAFSSPGGTPVAEFTDNDAVSIGARISFKF